MTSRHNIVLSRLHLAKSLLILCLFAGSTTARAFDLQLRGFADLVGSKSSTDNPVNTIGNHAQNLTFDPESRIGLNLSSDLGGGFTFASQLLGQGDDGGNYFITADWIFVTYRPVEEFSFRVGLQINPAFLYTEQDEVGFLYPWTRLPYEVYGLDPLDSFYGLSVIYTKFMGPLQLRAQLFGGGGDVSIQSGTSSIFGTVNDDRGLEVSLIADHFKVRAGYIACNPDLSTTAQVPVTANPSGPTGTYTSHADVGHSQLFSFGARGDYQNFMGIAEFIRFVNSGTFASTASAGYGTLGYQVLPWLSPYATYAWRGSLSGTAFIYPNPAYSTTAQTNLHSALLGLDFKVNASMVMKAEYMRSQANFVDTTKNYGANTYTASVDVVF